MNRTAVELGLMSANDSLIEELQAECRRLRELASALTAKLLIEGPKSQHPQFEIISMDDHGRQQLHPIRDVYYPDSYTDPYARPIRVIIRK